MRVSLHSSRLAHTIKAPLAKVLLFFYPYLYDSTREPNRRDQLTHCWLHHNHHLFNAGVSGRGAMVDKPLRILIRVP